MENLLVTGGCGFIGANFVRHLLTDSDFTGRIINVDKLTYAGNLENLTDIADAFPRRYRFARVDICDPEALGDVFDQYRIDAVCHFAAESHVDRSIEEPGAFIDTNIVGTFNLLELARKNHHRVSLFHHVSTDEVFGSLGLEGAFTEKTPYDPSSPYSASKAASDHLVRAYGRTYDLPVTLSNCSNNYGPHQFPEKLIPLMILNALENKALPVYGKGTNVRDWLYVMDHCRAIWTIMKKGRRGETYNIGGRCEKPNLEVVELICDLVDKSDPGQGDSRRDLITFVQDRPGHDFRYAMDCTKLQTELSWEPLETFESGLGKTVQWYLGNLQWVEHIQSGEYRDWVKRRYGA